MSARSSRAPRAGVEREGAAGDFRGALEIEEAELFAELDVALRRESERRLFAPHAHHGILLRDLRRPGTASCGRFGTCSSSVALRGFELLRFVFELRDFLAERAHLRLDRRGVFALAPSSRRSPC